MEVPIRRAQEEEEEDDENRFTSPYFATRLVIFNQINHNKRSISSDYCELVKDERLDGMQIIEGIIMDIEQELYKRAIKFIEQLTRV